MDVTHDVMQAASSRRLGAKPALKLRVWHMLMLSLSISVSISINPSLGVNPSLGFNPSLGLSLSLVWRDY